MAALQHALLRFVFLCNAVLVSYVCLDTDVAGAVYVNAIVFVHLEDFVFNV